MCLASIYEVGNKLEKLVCSSVTQVEVQDGSLVVTDLLGRKTSLQGTISKLDLANSRIYVSSASQQKAAG